MASDRPTSAKERKARMEAVAARLEAEEKERLQEHRRACGLAEQSAAGGGGGGVQQGASGAEDATAEDDAALLEFEAEVAVTAGRHFVVAKTNAAKSEIAMLDRAEELVSRLRDERDHLTSHLERLKLSSRESSRENGEPSPTVGEDSDMEAQAEVDRMFAELVGEDGGSDDCDDDWLSLADPSRVSAAMAAAVADSSRPASGVSDPQPRSPPQGTAHAHVASRVGIPVAPEAEPEVEPKPDDPAQASDQRRSADAKRRSPGDKQRAARTKGEQPKPRRAGAILGVRLHAYCVVACAPASTVPHVPTNLWVRRLARNHQWTSGRTQRNVQRRSPSPGN